MQKQGIQRITPFLWFDDQAEAAAELYVSIFPHSKITIVNRYNDAQAQAAGRKPGSVMAVSFVLDGQEFSAINGGPVFKFTEAISLVVNCDSQDEIDHYWDRLGEGGDPNAQRCGWLKDRYGLSWQIVPRALLELLADPARAPQTGAALMQMKKIDIEKLKRG